MPVQYVRYVSTVFDVCVCSVCIIHGICISPDKTNELWNCCVLCLHGQIGHLIMSDPSAWSVVGAHWTTSERCLPDSDLLDLNRHKFSDIFTEFHRLKHRFIMIQLTVPERNTAFQPFCFFFCYFFTFNFSSPLSSPPGWSNSNSHSAVQVCFPVSSLNLNLSALRRSCIKAILFAQKHNEVFLIWNPILRLCLCGGREQWRTANWR